MALNCSDAVTARIDPQVVHTRLNTGVYRYAHTMHSFMNIAPFNY